MKFNLYVNSFSRESYDFYCIKLVNGFGEEDFFGIFIVSTLFIVFFMAKIFSIKVIHILWVISYRIYIGF